MQVQVVLAAVCGAVLCAFAFAASARSGEVNITQCSGAESRSIAVDAQNTFGNGTSVGTVRSTPTGGMFDLMTSRCIGAFRTVAGKPSLWGHCE